MFDAAVLVPYKARVVAAVEQVCFFHTHAVPSVLPRYLYTSYTTTGVISVFYLFFDCFFSFCTFVYGVYLCFFLYIRQYKWPSGPSVVGFK